LKGLPQNDWNRCMLISGSFRRYAPLEGRTQREYRRGDIA
jgi:hypothetical protein